MGGSNVSKRKSHNHWAAKCKVDFTMEFEQRCIPLEPSLEEQNRNEMNKLASFFQQDESEVHDSGTGVITKSVNDIVTIAALAFTEATSRGRTSFKTEGAEEAALKAAKHWRAAAAASAASASGTPPKCADCPRLDSSAEQSLASPASPHIGSSAELPAAVGVSPVTRKTVGIKGTSIVDVPNTSTQTPRCCAGSADRFRGTVRASTLHRPLSPREIREASSPVPITVAPLFKREVDKPPASHYEFFTKNNPGENPVHRKARQSKSEIARKLYLKQLPGMPSYEGESPGLGSSFY